MSDRQTMWIAISVVVICFIGIGQLQDVLPGGKQHPFIQALQVIAGLAVILAIVSGRHVARESRERERSPRESDAEKVALLRGAHIGPWVLAAALLTLVAMVLVDSPKIRLLGEGEQVDGIKRFLLLTSLLGFPLVFLLLFAPVVSALHRSLLPWGLGLVFAPVNFVVVFVLIRLARQEMRERATAASAPQDLRSL